VSLREEIRSKALSSVLAACIGTQTSDFNFVIHALLGFCNDSVSNMIKYQLQGLLRLIPKQNLVVNLGKNQETESVFLWAAKVLCE
jgi:hypothetical protein